MAAAKNIKKPNVTPKASEIEVNESAEVMVEENNTTDAIVETVTDTVETSDVNEVMDDVTINEDTTVAVPKEKMVKVRLREDHKCSIGGVTYVLKKGVVHTVPEFVKTILMKADVLQSL